MCAPDHELAEFPFQRSAGHQPSESHSQPLLQHLTGVGKQVCVYVCMCVCECVCYTPYLIPAFNHNKCRQVCLFVNVCVYVCITLPAFTPAPDRCRQICMYVCICVCECLYHTPSPYSST